MGGRVCWAVVRGLAATICSPWIYWKLRRYASQVHLGNPRRLKAISTAKRKNDALDARTLADLPRCDPFPTCYVPPREYESLRCFLRELALLVRLRVMLKNKTAGLLIERGVPYEPGSCTITVLPSLAGGQHHADTRSAAAAGV
jgi:transposase